jgi:hypothetical protein
VLQKWRATKKRLLKNKEGRISLVKIIFWVVAFLAALIVFCSSLSHVPVEYVGVETNMSVVAGKCYSSGWYVQKMNF